MNALNLLKHYAGYYTAANHPEIIHIENAKFVSITGRGSFTEEIFYQRIELLKQVAQAIVNLFQDSNQAFEISVLEGLYWNHNQIYGPRLISRVFDTAPLSELNYRLMIRLPEYATEPNITVAKGIVEPIHNELLNGIELFEYQEGKCLQMLHKGPFIYEVETLSKIEQFANENSLVTRGAHHEIYLVDFTKGASQENQRTILREPVN